MVQALQLSSTLASRVWDYAVVGDNWEALGIAVRRARIQLGYTSGPRFAAAAGIAQATLNRLENGTGEPSERVLLAVEQALGWPLGLTWKITRGEIDPWTLELDAVEIKVEVQDGTILNIGDLPAEDQDAVRRLVMRAREAARLEQERK